MFANLGEDIRSATGGLFHRRDERTARLIDTTMLFAPRSGGVKRYLTAKRAWVAANRPGVRHTLVTPGKFAGYHGNGQVSVYAAPLPFGDGYRWPVFKRAWMNRLIAQRPTLIEAGDPYTPGLAALKAGDKLGIPVVGFCHTDLPALAALHIGEWAEKPVRKHWGTIYGQFDQVLTCSRYMAGKLEEAGVRNPVAMPLGVDTHIFDPRRADREAFRASLGLTSRHRLLVFAGRPAREKRLDVLVEAVEQLGEPYVLLMVGAGAGQVAGGRVIHLPYQSEPADVARVLASCDAFVHANDAEPFGLIVLEAMACGLPVVGVAKGGVGESVDEEVGQLSPRSTGPALAAAIEALFGRDLHRLSQAARQRAVACHAWDRVFGDQMDIYARLTGDESFGGFPARLS